MWWLLACAGTDPAPLPVEEVVEISEPPAPDLHGPAPQAAPEPHTPAPAESLRAPPEGLVPVPEGIEVEARYATADNFTGAPLPGYGAPGAWLVPQAAQALAQVRDALPEGLTLRVYDAYRPRRATLAMVAWATRTDQIHLLDEGYIARRSGHNKANTVDLTLLRDGAPLDMGTPWDTFSTASHTANAEGEVLANRLLLQDAMVAAGWRPYSKEWWHFSFPIQGLSALDVPYGCFEPTDWSAPEGWDQPGWQAPAVERTPCP